MGVGTIKEMRQAKGMLVVLTTAEVVGTGVEVVASRISTVMAGGKQ